jgi:hypothetical protein
MPTLPLILSRYLFGITEEKLLASELPILKITEIRMNSYVKNIKPLDNYCLMLWSASCCWLSGVVK